jgi:phage baseplate assembly protein W
MAIILGNKLVKDTTTYNDYAIGISLPIQITNTAFNQTFTTKEQLRSNIKNLLQTKKGERLMQPEFGSGLDEILFEQIDDDTKIQIEDAITSTIDKWLPYVNIEEIVVDINDRLKDTNTVNISLSFTSNGNPQLDSVTFNVGA